MPSTLDKTRKHISKKRNGVINALHVKSRDSMRLHKAGIRDQRLEKLASARSKREQPIYDRVCYFQESVREKGGEPLEMEAVKELINSFIHQYDEEYDEVKKSRRPGRPASAREDLLKMKISALKTEYDQGFWLPNVMSAEKVKLLIEWEGSWTYLTNIPWIKVSSSGQSRPADFPAKGLN
ncbi:translation machinery-associated protein 16 [Amphichorda felina]